MEQTRNRKMARNGGASAAWKRNVMATSVAAVLACVGMPAYAQKVELGPNTATGADGTAIGARATTIGDGGTALGLDAKALADRATAVGRKAEARAVDSVALGAGAIVNATATGSIALGAGSIATAAGEFSIGDVGRNLFRRITGVADGAGLHDAATVGQLVTATQQNHAVKYDWQDLDGDGIADANEVNYSKVTMGGATYDDATGVGGTTITNVAKGVNPSDAVNKGQLDKLADTPITFVANTGSVDTKLGEALSIQGKGTRTGPYSGANLKTEVDANGVLQIEMSESPKFGAVVINDARSGKITGVAAGTVDADAVNFGQLSIVGKSVAGALGGASAFDPMTQTVKADLSVGGKNYTDVDAALDAVDAKASLGWNVTASSVPSDQIKPGEAITFVGDTVQNGKVDYDATTNTLKIGVVDAPAFAGRVTANGGLTVASGARHPSHHRRRRLRQGGCGTGHVADEHRRHHHRQRRHPLLPRELD